VERLVGRSRYRGEKSRLRRKNKVQPHFLIDEATGYQEIKDKKALQAILDKYLRK